MALAVLVLAVKAVLTVPPPSIVAFDIDKAALPLAAFYGPHPCAGRTISTLGINGPSFSTPPTRTFAQGKGDAYVQLAVAEAWAPSATPR